MLVLREAKGRTSSKECNVSKEQSNAARGRPRGECFVGAAENPRPFPMHLTHGLTDIVTPRENPLIPPWVLHL